LRWLTLLFSAGFLFGAWASGGASEHLCSGLENRLISAGYENVACETTDSSIVVWCENRRIRYPVVWMVEALALVSDSIPEQMRVRVVAQRLGRPIIALSTRAGDVRRWIDGDVGTEAFREALNVTFAGGENATEQRNSSLRKIDLAIGPGRLLSEFGLPGVWVRANADLAAELTSAIAPGTSISGRVLFPVYNTGGPVSNDNRYNELRPGSILASWLVGLGASGFATVTGGMIELANSRYDSYGFVVDLKQYSIDGRWCVGGSFGYLAPARYAVHDDGTQRNRTWVFVWPLYNTPYEAWASYRVTGFDLRVTARWGRYLVGDRAWRMDVDRSFGEIKLAVFGIKSDGYSDFLKRVDRQNTRLLGGLRMEVPVPPRERGMPDRFRVTSTPAFAWSYRYRVGDVGVEVATKHSVEDVIGGYNPVTVANNLERARRQLRARGTRDNQPGNVLSSVGEP